MLIRSDRHTAADLSQWAELEEADRMHGCTLDRKIDRAMDELRGFIATGLCYCSVSWGKDSVVVADLVRHVDSSIPLMWVRVEPIKSPDCEAVRDAFAPLVYHEAEVWCSHDAQGWHATGTLEQGFKQAPHARHITGIRSEESSSRELSAAVHGTSTARVCRPILRWTAADVFAYLAIRDLPVHPAYAMLGGGRWDRHRLRVASLGGRRGDGMGRAEWEREYYGDVLARLAAKEATR